MPLASSRGQSPYSALDKGKDEIRLVTILPPLSTEEDEICCTLSHMPLRDAPAYEALSYTWADMDKDSSLSATISLEGCPFRVTKNLEAALWQLRFPRKERVFWIDAICIDQKNDPERNHQVAMMRTIYEKANEVAIWLGSENDDSHLAFVFLQGVLKREDAVEWTQDILLNPKLELLSRALALVLLRDYWERIWIVQEVISARRKMVYCGSESISWDGFRKAWKFISDQCDSVGADSAFAKLTRTEGPQIIEQYWKLSEQGVPDLFSALRMFRTTASSDPRDKVYGIIGLTTARDDPRFTVDYSLTFSEVYINVVKYVVATSQRLDIISVDKGPLHPDWLPSWVPDWSYESSCDSPIRQMQFSAALSKPANALFDSCGRVLRVRGTITGMVKSAAISVDESRPELFSYRRSVIGEGYGSHHFYFFLLAICDWHALAMRDASYETVSEAAFYETIYSRTTSAMETEIIEARFECFAAAICQYMPNYPMKGLLGDAFLRLQQQVKHEDFPRVLEAASEDFTYTLEKMFKRRLFVSSEGRMGVAPYRAEVGDLVCVLFGCERPVILRPHDGHHTVIGDAYVRGLMNEEAIEGLSSGKFQAQEFEIH